MEISFEKSKYNISLEFKELLTLRNTMEELIPSSEKFESHLIVNEILIKIDNCLFETAKENLK